MRRHVPVEATIMKKSKQVTLLISLQVPGVHGLPRILIQAIKKEGTDEFLYIPGTIQEDTGPPDAVD